MKGSGIAPAWTSWFPPLHPARDASPGLGHLAGSYEFSSLSTLPIEIRRSDTMDSSMDDNSFECQGS
jgi:hypothetical protein